MNKTFDNNIVKIRRGSINEANFSQIMNKKSFDKVNKMLLMPETLNQALEQ